MHAKAINPILNVTSIPETLNWFERLGWTKGWQWGDPVGFAAVYSGNCEIFLCEGMQGGKGKGPSKSTFGPNGDQVGDKGVWLSVWVDDVDPIYEHCVANGIEVTYPPTDKPWGVREMHVRHPDGHVFRIGKALEEEAK